MIKIEGTDLVPLDLLVPKDAGLASILTDRQSIEWQENRLSIVNLAGLRVLERLRGSSQDRADLEALGPES